MVTISKQLAGRVPDTGSAIDLHRTTEEVVECLSNLQDFDKVPVETQKSFFCEVRGEDLSVVSEGALQEEADEVRVGEGRPAALPATSKPGLQA